MPDWLGFVMWGKSSCSVVTDTLLPSPISFDTSHFSPVCHLSHVYLLEIHCYLRLVCVCVCSSHTCHSTGRGENGVHFYQVLNSILEIMNVHYYNVTVTHTVPVLQTCECETNKPLC